jgi:hypothetical protein
MGSVEGPATAGGFEGTGSVEGPATAVEVEDLGLGEDDDPGLAEEPAAVGVKDTGLAEGPATVGVDDTRSGEEGATVGVDDPGNGEEPANGEGADCTFRALYFGRGKGVVDRRRTCLSFRY